MNKPPSAPYDLTTPRGILKVLGGTSPVMARLGVGASAVSNWRSSGFPPSVEGDLLVMAAELGVPLTITVLRAATPRPRATIIRSE
jgi:transcriptional regulator with XRE-family HTH domain